MSEATSEYEGYWYLHQNGQRIFKPKAIVDPMGTAEYFNSPFVKHFWRGDHSDNRTPEEKKNTQGATK